jgi:tRNA A37 threonylcarbamoyladenosine modification protein TsaB
VVSRAAPEDAPAVEAVADAGRGALYVARYRRDGAGLALTDAPRRVEQSAWTAAAGHVAVTFDDVAGTARCAARAGEALARAAAAAALAAPLSRAGLEPVYLGANSSAAPDPRV